MPKFRVILSYDTTETVNVEAHDGAAAMDTACDMARGGLCHQCSRHLDLGDINGAEVLDEKGDVVLSDGVLAHDTDQKEG